MRNFLEHFFYRTPLVAASVKMRKLNIAGGVFLKLETMFLEKKNPRKTVIANLLNQAFFVNYMLFASYCGIWNARLSLFVIR